MEKKRSVGLIIFGIFSVIYTLLIIWIVYRVCFVVFSGWSLTLSSKIKLTTMLGGAFGILVAGIGVSTLVSWARKPIVIVAIINLLLWLYCLIETVIEAVDYFGYDRSFGPSFPQNLLVIPLLLFNLLCIYFFTRPKVKEQFK